MLTRGVGKPSASFECGNPASVFCSLDGSLPSSVGLTFVTPVSCQLSCERPVSVASSTAPKSSAIGSNSVASSSSGTGIAAGASVGSSSCAVCSSRSTYVPASMARASSIRSLNAFSAANARCGRSFRFSTSPIAPHSDSPVSRATRSSVSSVVLPMPRVGVLMTRSSEIESSGL